jgi:hypothetical protein
MLVSQPKDIGAGPSLSIGHGTITLTAPPIPPMPRL